ncbi:MAG TPA: PepSY-like domain-containing protein [Bacteroidia bacterium]|jgi:NifU-like protein involved in Fe-S cluster formation
MKKIALFSAFGFFAISAYAQEIKSTEVPPAIQASFTKLHPNAKVDKWEKEGTHYEAEFMDNKVETSVEFGPNGQLMATEVAINVSDLPKAASDYCTKNIAGKKISEAAKITEANGKVSYEAEVDGTDYFFDTNGNFVSKETEKHGDKK